MGSSGVFSASCSIAGGHAKVVTAYPRRCVEFGCLGDYRLDGVSSNLVFSSGIHLSLGRSGLGRCWKTPILKAAMDGYGVEEHEDLSKDALDTTVDKSNIVLEKQKDLLRLISERKKVVSLIKNSVINLEESEEHALDGDVAISSLDAAVREAVLEQQIESTSSEDAQTMEVRYVALESNVEPIERQSFDKDLHQELECNSGNTISVSQTSEGDIGRKFWVTDSEPMPSEKYEQHEDSNGTVANLDFVKPPPLAGANAMNVILVTCECSPWIKTGGLGDVAGALPKALARRGHRVMVIMPRYSAYADAQDTGIRRRYNVDGQDMEVNFFHAYIDGVDFVFIESPIFRNTEKNIYGGNRADILKRMVLFCKTAVEAPWYVPCGGACYGDGNLVFIANDWHTALLPVYLKAYYRDHGLMQYTRAVLVIHNIAHQGRGPVDEFRVVGLPNHYLDHFKFYDPVGGEHMNIFAAGIKAADRVVTVSHGYAWEIKTSEGGWGLHNIVNENDWKLRGIVNGIDTNDWRPETDIYLQSDGYVNYSIDTLQEGKPQCKTALQRELGFPVRPDVPLIAFIGRLDHQKGIDIIGEVIPWMMDQDVQLVMLGTGRPDLEDMLRHFEGQYRDKVRGWVGFSVQMAHRITAGADILLMPSRFEPCGLNQLYAMQYATVPVVHAVGGLRDTVTPFNPFDETGLGWTFPKAEANELMNALSNCLLTYREYKKSWEGLQRRGMMQDLSWDHAAQLYEEVLVAAKYQW